MTQDLNENQTAQNEDIDDSVLDQVIGEQHEANFHGFNPKKTIVRLFDILSEQEQEILRRRYGLLEVEFAKRQTLKEIGDYYKLTRERIRQIENRAIKKLKDRSDLKQVIAPFSNVINQILEDYGGIMEENFFLDRLVDISSTDSKDIKKVNFEKQAVLFLIDKLVDETEKVASDDYFMPSWRTKSADLENFKKILDSLHSFIESRGNPIHKDKLISAFRKSSQEIKDLAEKVIHSALEISSRVKSNPFGEWGFNEWKSISPKRMGDKILIIMERHGQPLHFNEISGLINKQNFDNKKAHPATIHNELIMRPEFVLVGRGVYGLKEWGYKPGIVTDVVTQILKENGPMAREDIIDELLSQRMVKKGTVVLALSNKEKFKKLEDGRYDAIDANS